MKKHEKAAGLFLGTIAGVATLLVWTATTASGWAAGRVELLLSVEQGAPLMAQQTWMRELGQAGVRNVRVRAAQSGDRSGIEVRGSAEQPIYLVIGTLTSGNDIVVAGERFREGQAGRLARWLGDLATHGPPRSHEPAGAFGLSPQQNEQLRRMLARPVGASTKGQTRGQIVQRIRDGLSVFLELDASAASADWTKEPVGEELAGLSRGTALAYVLRGGGYCLVPRRAAGGTVQCAVVPAERAREIWPVGWPPEKPRLTLLPELYKLRPIHLENVTVAQVVEAVAERLKIPLLLDHNALARHGIDPSKVLVSVPAGQTNYDKVLTKTLFEARLKREIRVDESGKPFLWVTSLKPM